jgi:hypothetical protein
MSQHGGEPIDVRQFDSLDHAVRIKPGSNETYGTLGLRMQHRGLEILLVAQGLGGVILRQRRRGQRSLPR